MRKGYYFLSKMYSPGNLILVGDTTNGFCKKILYKIEINQPTICKHTMWKHQ